MTPSAPASSRGRGPDKYRTLSGLLCVYSLMILQTFIVRIAATAQRSTFRMTDKTPHSTHCAGARTN